MAGLAAASWVVGCGTDLGSCPPGSEAQQSLGRAVVDANCVSCHSTFNESTDRFGAPSGLDWDNLEAVRDWAGNMLGEAQDGDMPPKSFADELSAEQIESMRIWLACGAQDVPL